MFLLILLISLIILTNSTLFNWNSDINGGGKCAQCTILTALVSQQAQLYNLTPNQGFERLCSYFSYETPVKDACNALRDTFGWILDFYIRQGLSPDEVCFQVNWCNDNNGPMCRLFPASKIDNIKKKNIGFMDSNICNIPGMQAICKIIDRWADDHYPVDDIDGDRFSDKNTMRGTMWRGKDCNDKDPDIHPGRRPELEDRAFDSNCNGIYGSNNITGIAYETELCPKNIQQYGVAVWGDSAGAHFHAPPQWFNATEINSTTLEPLYFTLLDELDWPMLSATTAYFDNITELDKINPGLSYIEHGPVESIYKYLYQRNRCMHRDYQNLGINGERSSSMKNQGITTISRHATKDHPIFGIFELIGNDVCSGHPDFSHMTTPDEFYSNNLASFEYLDSVLPYGSKILAMGLANGTVLYSTMHDRIHPIGWLNKDVTYKNMYDWFNCLQISPCWGWMNSNATVRQMTQDRADQLSQSLYNLTVTEKFENITVRYIDCPVDQVIQYWNSQGGETWELIEPVDGFHPDQLANSLMAKIIWDNLNANMSDWVPKENPNNDKIIELFGDQGGY